MEIGNIAITRDEMNEFLQSHSAGSSVEEEEVIGDTAVVHVGGKPRYFLMPFVVHKTVITKEVLVCMLDSHFIKENPMVLGHEET